MTAEVAAVEEGDGEVRPLLPLTFTTEHGACEQGVEHKEGWSGGDDEGSQCMVSVKTEFMEERTLDYR